MSILFYGSFPIFFILKYNSIMESTGVQSKGALSSLILLNIGNRKLIPFVSDITLFPIAYNGDEVISL